MPGLLYCVMYLLSDISVDDCFVLLMVCGVLMLTLNYDRNSLFLHVFCLSCYYFWLVNCSGVDLDWWSELY